MQVSAWKTVQIYRSAALRCRKLTSHIQLWAISQHGSIILPFPQRDSTLLEKKNDWLKSRYGDAVEK